MQALEHLLSVHVIFTSLAVIHLTTGADWGYSGDKGPSTWPSRYPECGGKNQSPINIHTDHLNITHSALPGLIWHHYNRNPASVTLFNNGHTVQVIGTPEDGKEPYVMLNSKKFVLDQTHFHWGKKNTEGSEHTINNKRYPLEMHAVHRRVEGGTQVSPPEIIVITILFEISKQKNPGLERFVHHIPSVKMADTRVKIPPFPAATLIPQFTTFYYQYHGSLTTPPCSEVVTFLIRDELAKVSTDQLELFRVALNEENEEMSGNFRPIQPLNGRTVYYITH